MCFRPPARLWPRPSTAILAALLGATANLAAQTVSITAPDNGAKEAGYYPGTYQLTRAGGDTAQPLTIGLAFSGTAIPGEDYECLPNFVTFAAGQTSVDLMLDPVNDADVEAEVLETAIATVLPGPGYTVGSPAAATVFIEDNETFTNTAPLHYAAAADSATAITLRWMDNFATETRYRVQYRVEGATAWTTIDNLPPNTTSRQVTGLTPGQAYEFRVNAYQNTTAAQNQNPMRAVALDPGTPPPFTTFEQWRAFGGLDGARRATGGRAGDDPDADGRRNLLEYVLGSNPLVPDAGAAPGVSQLPGGSIQVQWPDAPAAILDAWSALEESPNLAGWGVSPLSSSAAAGLRTAPDPRGGNARHYRIAAGAAIENPSPTVTCWGDSLTATTPGYPSKLAAALGRTVQNCGIGGDTSIQIRDRMVGLQITSPRPTTAASAAPGTPVRIAASRTAHARVMNPAYRSLWATYAGTIAEVSMVEFFNRGVKIGESSAPLAAAVTSNRSANPQRVLSAGHPFANGDVVHFPSGPLPSPLVPGKTYHVRDADAAGFSLTEDDSFVGITATAAAPNTVFDCPGHPFVNGDAVWFPTTPLPAPLVVGRTYYVRDAGSGVFSLAESPGGAAVSMTSGLSAVLLKGPPRAPLSLTADFAAATPVRGPFVFDWIHPGGATDLSIRTHTDRDANTFVFWLGRNNSSRPHEIYADLHAAVEHIKAINGRFLILGLLTASNELAGNQYYFNAINLNQLLRREFPNEFVDIRKKLILAGQPTGQDALDRTNDATPSSLRSDTLHLNDAGYQVVADVLAAEITARGW